ncbi:hypothetical protein A2Z53_00375 [Candidatus Giovannonibacteria bacterium RIFCSPHIGHO2_02_42_15]|uniref:DNA polymerase III subunit delta n=2 Tax=Candidatus Giovannoniibacteriota TaxID=1752738 RepID=A0A1F5VNR4_9BACT|nr:MAG: hypothetical protein UV11_C0010G0031 [Candidatus Giovannonibacteria bacterium GW2011_GWF2_42_19]OGF64671.1 MAG: hypothetical protein A2Z53_00375 [Candidatus Giovannonibacteria bacterium RIFCSPHIGHO2_02_42_15]
MILRGDIEESLRKFFKEAKSAGAYLLISENPELKKSLIGFLKCEKRTYCKKCAYCQNTNLLDLYTYSGETLKIEEARQIQVEAQKSSWNGNKIFIIESQIPRDAQAVLLKTMEEPRANNYFIIEAAAVAGFTKPFLSRLNVFRAKSKDEGDKSLAKKLLTGGIKKRLEAAYLLSKEKKNMEKIFKELEFWIDERIEKSDGHDFGKISAFLSDFFEIKKKFLEKTYFNKMLLEHLVLSASYLESL